MKSIQAVVHFVPKNSSFYAEDNDDRERMNTGELSCECVNWKMDQFYVDCFNRTCGEKFLVNKNLKPFG